MPKPATDEALTTTVGDATAGPHGPQHTTPTAPKVLGGASGLPPLPNEQVVQQPSAIAKPQVPTSRQFRVMNGGYIVVNRCRTYLKAGKIITGEGYDLRALERQGIVLHEVDDSQSVLNKPHVVVPAAAPVPVGPPAPPALNAMAGITQQGTEVDYASPPAPAAPVTPAA